MAVRTDIVVDPTRSPRIITVLAPSTEVVIQDLHDTLRAFEDSNEGHPFDILVDSAGKEPLGGGVSVGVTTTLQNALLEFEPRNEAADEGTATTADPAGLLLIDSTASFLSTVEVGAHVLNATTGATSTVRAVDSDTQLSLEGLGGGTRQDWQVGDQFYVYNVAQCAVSGGNLVAVDDVGAPLDTPLYPSFCTQVKLASSSSATLQELSAIQYASFDGGVTVDVTSSNSGTLYPVGTREFPVNNMADADTIADTRGFRRFYINGNLTLDTVDVSDGHVFEGESTTLTTITINPGANVTDCEFRNATITGTLDGGNTLGQCIITNLNVVNGFVIECGIKDTVVLGGNVEAEFINCYSSVAGAATPTIDLGGSGQAMLVRNYSGAIKFQNKTGTDAASVDMLSGQIIIDSTVTAGTMFLRGISTLTDNSGSGATIDTSGLVYADQLQLAAFNGAVVIDTANGVSGTTFPLGTLQDPVNNIADAVAIAVARGLDTLRIIGNITVGAADVLDGYIVEGQGPAQTTITCTAGCSTLGTDFRKATIEGTLLNPQAFSDCHFGSGGVTFNTIGGVGTGTVTRCGFAGTVTLSSAMQGTFNFGDCFSLIPLGKPVFDFNGADVDVAAWNYSGGMEVRGISNVNGPQISADLRSGNILLTSSCTTGTFTIQGIALFEDQSAGTVVDTSGLIYANELQLAAFKSFVWYDDTGNAGTDFPKGTPEDPVNNLADALAIAAQRGLTSLHVAGTLTIGASDDISGFILEGENELTTRVVLTPGCTTVDTIFVKLILSGEVGGAINCYQVELDSLTNIGSNDGTTLLNECILLEGTTGMRAGLTTPGHVQFFNCFSCVSSGTGSTLDMNGTTTNMALREYNGALKIINSTGGNSVEYELDQGSLEFDATNTSGTATLRGLYSLTDNSGAGFTVTEDVPPAASGVASAVWDEVLTGATHNINQSAGKILRGLGNLVVHTDTAQGAGTGNNQIQLALSASSTDGEYDPSVIAIVDGTGAGQSRLILQYDGTSRTATVDRNWKINPDATSEYVVYADAGREHVNEGLAQGGTSNTITLNALASPIDQVYLHQTVFIRSGTGEDQVGIVTAYNGTTKVATIDGTWAVIPDTTSAYVMLPSHNNVSVEQFTAYGGVVTVDTVSGTAGTAYPVGTAATPVDNLADAKTIAATQGLEILHIVGTLVLGASDVVDGLVLEGRNELTDTVSVTAGASTSNTVFRELRLTGTLGGGVFADRCAMSAVAGIGDDTNPSLFSECILLAGTHTMRAGLTTPQNVQLVNCVAGLPNGTGVVLDMNGTTTRLALRKQSGSIDVVNYTGAQTSEFDFAQGAIDFDATNTTGTAILRGQYALTDNSGAGFTIVEEGGISIDAGSVWSVDLSTYTTAGTAGNILRKAYGLVKALLGLV